MSRRRSVWLVARREIIERGRSRGFILSVLFTTVLVVGSIILPTVLFNDDEATAIGIVGPAPVALAPALTATAAQFEREIALRTFADDAAADAALTAEEIDAVIDLPADLSTAGELRFAKDTDQGLTQVVTATIISLRLSDVVIDAGVDPASLAGVQQPPTVVALEPQTRIR